MYVCMYVCMYLGKIDGCNHGEPIFTIPTFLPQNERFFSERERDREGGNVLLSLLNRSMQALSIIHLRATVQWLSSNVQMANRNDVETNTTMCLMYS